MVYFENVTQFILTVYFIFYIVYLRTSSYPDSVSEKTLKLKTNYPSFSSSYGHWLHYIYQNLISFLLQGLFNGYLTFVISIAFIGACTAVIGDVAGHLGCFINLKDGVNAIAFVALGTSVPGTKLSVKHMLQLYLLYSVFASFTVSFTPHKRYSVHYQINMIDDHRKGIGNIELVETHNGPN